MNKKPIKLQLVGRLPNGAQEHCFKYCIRIGRALTRKKPVFKKQPKLLKIEESYDLFENLIAVRPYICKKYDIKWEIFESLLYLHPKNYFTIQDYNDMPKEFLPKRINGMIKMGLIRCCSKGKTQRDSLFTLSTHSKVAVANFYEYLFGEKKIPEMGNVLNMQDATPMEKLRFDLIKKINKRPVSDTKKRFFE